MNRPSLYAAFGDKRSLYLKTLERYRDQSRAQAEALRSDAPPLRIYLQRFYAAALDVYVNEANGARGCYSIGTAATEALVDPKVKAFLADSVESTDAFFAMLIRDAKARGEVGEAADPKALAAIATATLHTLAIRSRAGQSPEALRQLFANTIDLICRSHPVRTAALL